MALTGYPLPIIHQYAMQPESAQRLVRALAQIEPKRLAGIPWLSSSRISTLPDAAALLTMLVRRLEPGSLVVSAFGLREGLLHLDLPPQLRAADPLICAARDEGERQGRFPEHGDLLERWMRPLFADESDGDQRIRHAACLLADTGWRAHPDCRAERGLDIGMRSNWVGIDARGRGVLGHALYVSFGGGAPLDWLLGICGPADLALAARWGLALRLGQRLAGGTAETIAHGHLARTETTLPLFLAPHERVLYGEAVERRHKILAASFGLKPVLLTTS
jgi:exopolyphosphatase/guanosine-5'-triphosphate,3'-diphosphate pyrophosphatase